MNQWRIPSKHFYWLAKLPRGQIPSNSKISHGGVVVY